MQHILTEPLLAIEAAKILFPDSSKRTLQQWFKHGRFSINGQPFHEEKKLLQPGETLRAKTSLAPKPIDGLKKIYEDRYLIVIEKPSGLLSVDLDIPSDEPNAVRLLRRISKCQSIYPVHRLDRATSGVLLFAKGERSQEKLKEIFEKHEIEREYVAIAEGHFENKIGVWDSFLKELPSYDVICTTNTDEGKRAITHFEVIRRSKKYSYLRLKLETGRKHQIRVHCSNAGFPIVGDKRYGATEDPLKRMGLHARKLCLEHPFSKKKLSFIAPIPFEFKKLGFSESTLEEERAL